MNPMQELIEIWKANPAYLLTINRFFWPSKTYQYSFKCLEPQNNIYSCQLTISSLDGKQQSKKLFKYIIDAPNEATIKLYKLNDSPCLPRICIGVLYQPRS